MEQWYALHTKPNAEYQVAAALQQREIETYLPEFSDPKIKKGHRNRPFFACYLFVRIDFEILGLSSIQWLPGLRRIVMFDEQPIPLPDEVIGLIRQKIEQLEAIGDSILHNFKPGDNVRIKEGPLQDMIATFDGPTTSTQRVQILLDILGHICRVKVDVANLEKTSSETEIPIVKRPRRTRGQGRRIIYAGHNRRNYTQV